MIPSESNNLIICDDDLRTINYHHQLIINQANNNNNNTLSISGNNIDGGSSSCNNSDEKSDEKEDQDIETFDGWSKEEHIQFLQAFKRYGTDWEKVLHCLPSQNDLDQVNTHGIGYLQRGELGPAFYDFVKKQQSSDDSMHDESSLLSNDEEDIINHCPYLSTPDALASAFLTNRESVREWNLEMKRLESNLEKFKKNEPLDCSPTSTNSIYSDKMSLLQSNYGELLEKLDIEKQTQLLDEEVKLMRLDHKMKNLTPFERVVARESREKIEKLIGKTIPDKPIVVEEQSNLNSIEISSTPSNNTENSSSGSVSENNENNLTSEPSVSQAGETSALSGITNAPETTNSITNNDTIPPPPLNPELLTNQPNYRNIYTFLGALFDPNRYNVEELGAMLSPQEKEILQILLHNLSISLSTQQFQEEYSTYVHQISSSQILRQQQPTLSETSNANTTNSTNTTNIMNGEEPTTTNITNGEEPTITNNSGIVNPFTGQPQQISMLQLLSCENPQPSLFLNKQ